MKSKSSQLWATFFSFVVVAGFCTGNAYADFKILAVGDSLSSGKIDISVPDRASYRPYVWQSIENYLSFNNDMTNPLTVDFVGSQSGSAATPSGTYNVDGSMSQSVVGYGAGGDANSINPAWDDDHYALPGRKTDSFLGTGSDPISTELTNLVGAGDTPDLAIVMLGTNDLIQGSGNNNIFTGTNTTLGNIQSIISDLLSVNSSMQILMAPIPPVAYREPAPSVFNQQFNWTEETRIESPITADGSGSFISRDLVEWNASENKYEVAGTNTSISNSNPNLNNEGGGDATSNDVVQVLNDVLQEFAEDDGSTFALSTNVSWIDPFTSNTAQKFLVDHDGSNQFVDGSTGFDPTRYDDDNTPADNINTDLIDGLHLNYLGDQHYAGAIFAQGLLPAIEAAVAAQAVPEPSSFLFLSMLALAGGIANRNRRRAAKR